MRGMSFSLASITSFYFIFTQATMDRIGNITKLPIKKRISLYDDETAAQENSPKAAKRSKISTAEEIELLQANRGRGLLQQLQAASRSTHARRSSSPLNRQGKAESLAVPVIGPYGLNFVTPESITTHLQDRAQLAMAPNPPFQGRRDSNFVDLVKNEEVTDKGKNPLDLLSSVSALVAQSSGGSSQGKPKSDQSILVPDTTPKEMYQGQRHPETNLRHGKGVMKYLNGCRYFGYFVNDKREGYGKCCYPNGCVYTGHWKDGKRHGRGEICYANGDRYDGEWREDQRHGAGVYYWKDGTADVCQYERQKIVREGCRWSADKQKVWALNNGDVVVLGPFSTENTLPLQFGHFISRKLGVHFP